MGDHQGKNPVVHLRVSNLTRAINGVNWAIADLNKLSAEWSQRGFTLTRIPNAEAGKGHGDFIKKFAGRDLLQQKL